MTAFASTRFETIRRITADLATPEPIRFPTQHETLAVRAITATIHLPGTRPASWSAYGTRPSDSTPARIEFLAGQEDHCPPRLLALLAELLQADQPARDAGQLHS